MLEFIVLGRVPGTDIYLSFGVVTPAIISTALLACFYCMTSPTRAYKKTFEQINEITL